MILALDRLKAPATTDARKLRSREALYRAFLQLLESKSLEDISIREIAATANVGHATFYRHYATKEALLNDLAADEIHRMVNLTLPVLAASDTAAACVALCNHVQEHRQLWTTLLTGGAAGTLKEELLGISRSLAQAHDPQLAQGRFTEIRVILIVSSILETLAWWLRQQSPLPADDVAGFLAGEINAQSARQRANGPEAAAKV